ncbi:MAG: FGGY family carbohydrate kinase [Planctomycetota bacterium]
MLVLGLDSSTQSLTAIVLDLASGTVVHQHSLNFDRDFPAYETRNGVLPHADPAVVHAPPLMWVEALDRILSDLGTTVDLSQLGAIAGSAQQHGTVYLNDQFATTLADLQPEVALHQQCTTAFSRATAPVWMDSSTGVDCRAIDAALGGTGSTQKITGSAAYPRFSGPQIRAFSRREPDAWTRTAHVRLVSSFLASILAGRLAPTDHSDGSGMNLMDLDRRQWHGPALDAVAPDLARRLGLLCEPQNILGAIAPALAKRFGIASTCQIVAWSGDNPCSAIGLGLVRDGDCAMSLGTSDVLFAISRARPVMPAQGHTFISPTGDHMALFCFANGSLARAAVKDAHGLDWAGFSAAIDRTPSGNDGRLMLPWFHPEIVPTVQRPGVVRVNFSATDRDAECRAVVEAQCTSMRLRAHAAGIRPARLRATGGAAQNPAVLQIAADVFQCPVTRSQVTNTAALGAAIRAASAIQLTGGYPPSWQPLTSTWVEPLMDTAVQPRPALASVYRRLADDYAALEAQTLKKADPQT